MFISFEQVKQECLTVIETIASINWYGFCEHDTILRETSQVRCNYHLQTRLFLSAAASADSHGTPSNLDVNEELLEIRLSAESHKLLLSEGSAGDDSKLMVSLLTSWPLSSGTAIDSGWSNIRQACTLGRLAKQQNNQMVQNILLMYKIFSPLIFDAFDITNLQTYATALAILPQAERDRCERWQKPIHLIFFS